MKEYQQRVVDEKTALDEKLPKLAEFLNSSVCAVLDDCDQFLLREQVQVMSRYSQILGARIAKFK